MGVFIINGATDCAWKALAHDHCLSEMFEG